jgi:hypothetical protein
MGLKWADRNAGSVGRPSVTIGTARARVSSGARLKGSDIVSGLGRRDPCVERNGRTTRGAAERSLAAALRDRVVALRQAFLAQVVEQGKVPTTTAAYEYPGDGTYRYRTAHVESIAHRARCRCTGPSSHRFPSHCSIPCSDGTAMRTTVAATGNRDHDRRQPTQSSPR